MSTSHTSPDGDVDKPRSAKRGKRPVGKKLRSKRAKATGKNKVKRASKIADKAALAMDLARGKLTHQKIADKHGISRAMVAMVATGERLPEILQMIQQYEQSYLAAGKRNAKSDVAFWMRTFRAIGRNWKKDPASAIRAGVHCLEMAGMNPTGTRVEVSGRFDAQVGGGGADGRPGTIMLVAREGGEPHGTGDPAAEREGGAGEGERSEPDPPGQTWTPPPTDRVPGQ